MPFKCSIHAFKALPGNSFLECLLTVFTDFSFRGLFIVTPPTHSPLSVYSNLKKADKKRTEMLI